MLMDCEVLAGFVPSVVKGLVRVAEPKLLASRVKDAAHFQTSTADFGANNYIRRTKKHTREFSGLVPYNQGVPAGLAKPSRPC